MFLGNQVFPRLALVIWYVLEDVSNITAERLAYPVQILQSYPCGEIIIQFVNGRRTDTCYSGQFSLAPTLFSEDAREMVYDHLIAPTQDFILNVGRCL